MATSQTWRLKRFGRFVPGTGETEGKPWKVFDVNGNKPGIVLTIVESGYLLVLQGQKSLIKGFNEAYMKYSAEELDICSNQMGFDWTVLVGSSQMSLRTFQDTIPLHCASDFLKVQQKSDNLMFRFTVKGEGRMIRMQFDGSTRAEAIKECSSVVEKLKEYMPVTPQDAAPPPPNQSPAEVSVQGKAVGAAPEAVQGSLSIKRLTQHFLGETAVTLPQVYCHASLAQGDLEPILRICLLDPSFHAFVEKVEGELRKLLE